MKILFGKKKWCIGFSAERRRILRQVSEAVEAWIEQKGFTKRLSKLEEIAADIGVPADQLSIYIRVHKYKSVLNWRKELRIQEAREMLLSYPELPISVIGEMVGIDDKTNFKRQFRQVMGTRPRDWREQHLG
jgi:transcriptional regulator GlxA family with amidase domain